MTTADLKTFQIGLSAAETNHVSQDYSSGVTNHPPTTGGASWQITFGDLLTLLLCFAALAVRAEPINGSENDGQSQYNQVVTESAAHSANLAAAGTALATIEAGSAQIQSEVSALEDGSFLIIRSNERALELVIGVVQLDPRSLQLWDFAYNSLVAKLDSLLGRELQLTVAECSTQLTAAADAGARYKRATQLRRQLADTYGSSAVGIAALGSGCESLENTGALEGTVMVLRAELAE